MHLATAYNRNQEVRNAVRMLGSLAFVPTHRVQDAFNLLDDRLGTTGLVESYPALGHLYRYFADNFVGVRRQGYRAPRYPPTEWNQFTRVRDRLPRSDSSLEGWHFAIQALFGVHPQFTTFLERLRSEALWADQTMTLFEQGREVRRTRSLLYERLDENLQRLVDRWENEGGYYGDALLTYLENASNYFKMENVDDDQQN